MRRHAENICCNASREAGKQLVPYGHHEPQSAAIPAFRLALGILFPWRRRDFVLAILLVFLERLAVAVRRLATNSAWSEDFHEVILGLRRLATLPGWVIQNLGLVIHPDVWARLLVAWQTRCARACERGQRERMRTRGTRWQSLAGDRSGAPFDEASRTKVVGHIS